ncbi:RHS repeat protein, partial [Chitinivorax sp. B]|uniref:RHS repeat protein n=1 Tax=Chitinivorax sp. B TaxID=2502235 RepID=UPI0014854037
GGQYERAWTAPATAGTYTITAQAVDRWGVQGHSTVTLTTTACDFAPRPAQDSPTGPNVGTRYQYDALDRLSLVADPQHHQTTYTYAAGNVATRNSRGFTTLNQYRATGSPDQPELMGMTAQEEPTAKMTMVRDLMGNITSITQNNITRSYHYDSRQFLISQTHPEVGQISYGRDAAGNMITRQVGTGPKGIYVYDELNRLKTLTYPGNSTPPISYTYDFNGNPLTETAGGVVRSYVYDANNNPIQDTLQLAGRSFRLGYGYNGNDALETLTYPSNQVVNFGPDALGRPTGLSNYIAKVTYRPSGAPFDILLTNGLTRRQTEDSRLQPKTLHLGNDTCTTINTSYSYDPEGNTQSVRDTFYPDWNRSFDYDPIDRLTAANGPWGAGGISYDGNGNITSQRFGSYVLSYRYDTARQLLTGITGNVNYSYQYDGYGNVTNRGTGQVYRYDDVGNLRTVNAGTPSQIVYEYDAKGNRVRSTGNGRDNLQVYAGNTLLYEIDLAKNENREHYYLGSSKVASRIITG